MKVIKKVAKDAPKKMNIFFLMFICFTFSLGFLQANIVTDLEEKLKLELFDEVFEESEKLIQNDTENLEYREIQFKVFLGKQDFKSALSTLEFIKDRRKNYETDYLEALYFQKTSQFELATQKLLTIAEQVRRYPETYLRLYEIDLIQTKYESAKRWLDQYKRLEGDNEQWYTALGQWLVTKYNISNPSERINLEDEIKNHLEKFSQKYKTSHEYYFLLSTYQLIEFNKRRDVDYLDNALNLMNQTLLLAEKITRFRERKIYLLYLKKNWSELESYINSIIDTLPPKNLEDNNEKNLRQRLRYLEFMMKFFQYQHNNEPFKLLPDSDLSLLSRLFKLMKDYPDNMLYRYFLEELVIENSDLTNQSGVSLALINNLIKGLSEDRFLMGKNALDKGRYLAAKDHVLRGIQLNPNNIDAHVLHLEYLRLTKQDEAAYITIIKIEELIKANPKYESLSEPLKLKKAILKKRLRISLRNKYRLPKLDTLKIANKAWLEKVEILKIGFTMPIQDSLNQFNYIHYNKVFAELLYQYLKKNYYHKIDYIDPVDEDFSYDYLIQMSFLENQNQTVVDYSVHNHYEKESLHFITNQQRISSSKDRYQLLISGVEEVLNVIPKLGRVVRVENNRIVVNLGRMAKITQEDRFRFEIDSEKSFAINQLDDYYSEIVVDDFNLLSKIEIDKVVFWELKPEEETAAE